MLHNIVAEFLGTALMILFGVGVHCDEVLNKTKYRGSAGAGKGRWYGT